MANDLWGSQLTDMMMANPWMFDPTQKSNQFSNYNNMPMPYPPTYDTGAGGPTNAATGKPIQSFQDWQKANPGGTTINATPAQPQAAAGPSDFDQTMAAMGMGGFSQSAQSRGMSPRDISTMIFGAPMPASMTQPTQATQQRAAPQASGPPNNWGAALTALSNPGTPAIQGATVPMATGYQPAGGVNRAFLNQAGGGQGMNQGFLSALRAIQGRPQG